MSSELTDVERVDAIGCDSASTPSIAITVVETADIDEQAERLKGWSQEYAQVSPGRFRGSLREVWVDDVQIYRETTNCQLWERGAVSADTFSMVLQLGGDSRAIFNGRAVSAGDIIFCRGGDEWCTRSGEGWDVLSLTVPVARLEACFGERLCTAHTDLYSNLTEDARLALARLTHAARLTLEPGMRRSSLGPPEFLSDYLVGAFHEVLTSLRPCGSTREHRIDGASSRRQVELFIAACQLAKSMDLEKAAAVDALCSKLDVSRRTLQSCFVQLTGLPPCRFLRAVRLNAVRRSLRRGTDGGLSVLDVAAENGFWHGSRFAKYYRELFHEAPSATLKGQR